MVKRIETFSGQDEIWDEDSVSKDYYHGGYEVKVHKVNERNKIVAEHTERMVEAENAGEAIEKVLESLKEKGV